MHSALIGSKIQVDDVMVDYNSSTLSGLPRSLNGESGRASHLVYKFDKQYARCNNSQILNLFEFPHLLAP